MPNLTIDAKSLEPLYAAWEEPNRHRVRGDDGAEERQGRRPSAVTIAQNLRAEVKLWRDAEYAGSSDTTKYLLNHWFGGPHDLSALGGPPVFRYYFCQREAVETFIFLREQVGVSKLSELIDYFGGAGAETAALGVPEEENQWARFAFKLATGAGKTKCMSLCMAWSYFHALRESDSPMARHFVVIAPNLTVFERLKEDFKPEGGGPDIFDRDPVIPVEWRGDWNVTTVLQDEAGGAATGGSLYLTNIHRLYEKRKAAKDDDRPAWAGPAVSRAKALDTGAALRQRVTGHKRVLVLNDEAHHVWDMDSAWNEAIDYLHHEIRNRGGEGIAAQLDFSATPKDNKANLFKHIVCDSPLGEAVDAGIVKVPIIGSTGNLLEQATDNAAHRYEAHLRLGYQRWLESDREWKKSGKKPLMFVMCSDTQAADEITRRLNDDAVFKHLNGKTVNLHTNLKGKLKKKGTGKNATYEFVESEKEITDEDLKALRKLSRELDSDASPYRCIVSVLMLREGWDVRNVTTIVPLRPYSSKAGILPEQTLGRGLRRMTPPGQANETVVVVEHEAFASLYRNELAQEGLFAIESEVDKVPATTVSIFPDPAKDHAKLAIDVPRIGAATVTQATLGPVTMEEIRKAHAKYAKLPLGAKGPEELQYEGRQLITGEVVERMKVSLPLLENGVGALSYYVRELEYVCKVKNTHQTLAPLLQTFLEEVVFEKPASLYDAVLVARLGDGDVREHIRAVFIPLVRSKTQIAQAREPDGPPMKLAMWKPFQVTSSEKRPCVPSDRTLFNLVPCANPTLETQFAQLCGTASDAAAFAKNAGPQCLRIDYLADGARLAFYTPDFFVRLSDGTRLLVETKGRVDKDVPAKARAAVDWCKAASRKEAKWEYLYLAENIFYDFRGRALAELARMAGPSLADLLGEAAATPHLFSEMATLEGRVDAAAQTVVDPKLLDALPPAMRKAADNAIGNFRFTQGKPGMNFAGAFAQLFGVTDRAAKGLIVKLLQPSLPAERTAQDRWFKPDLSRVDQRQVKHFEQMAMNLMKTVVHSSGTSHLGLLRSCLDEALEGRVVLPGVLDAVKTAFKFKGGRDLLDSVTRMNIFRNTRVAHQEVELTDAEEAKKGLAMWIQGLGRLAAAG